MSKIMYQWAFEMYAFHAQDQIKQLLIKTINEIRKHIVPVT